MPHLRLFNRDDIRAATPPEIVFSPQSNPRYTRPNPRKSALMGCSCKQCTARTKGDRHGRPLLRLDRNCCHCRRRCRRRRFGVCHRNLCSGSGGFRHGPLKQRPGANRTCRGFGPMNSTRPCSVPPSMRTRNFSPRRNAPNWTECDPSCSAGLRPSATSTAPTMRRRSFQRSIPGRARPRSSIRPMAGFHR